LGLKFNFGGNLVVFNERNIHNNNLILIKIGENQVTTREVKAHARNLINFLNNALEVLSIGDEKYERYSAALNVLTSSMEIFSSKVPEKLTVEAGKITIDVVREIALMSGQLDDFGKKAVKSAAFVAKLFLDSMEVKGKGGTNE